MTRTSETPTCRADYDPQIQSYRLHFDSRTPPSETVVTAVATLTDRPQHELPPLWEAIDPEALDDLFQGAGNVPGDGHLAFDYANHRVTVRATGLVTIEPPHHHP